MFQTMYAKCETGRSCELQSMWDHILSAAVQQIRAVLPLSLPYFHLCLTNYSFCVCLKLWESSFVPLLLLVLVIQVVLIYDTNFLASNYMCMHFLEACVCALPVYACSSLGSGVHWSHSCSENAPLFLRFDWKHCIEKRIHNNIDSCLGLQKN